MIFHQLDVTFLIRVVPARCHKASMWWCRSIAFVPWLSKGCLTGSIPNVGQVSASVLWSVWAVEWLTMVYSVNRSIWNCSSLKIFRPQDVAWHSQVIWRQRRSAGPWSPRSPEDFSWSSNPQRQGDVWSLSAQVDLCSIVKPLRRW